MPALAETHDRIPGSKATVLRRLEAAGFRVPDFVISPANLREVVNRLGTPLAVRSSATLEDGQGHSFAGQFQSYLGLYTVQQVEQAIRMCHESIHASRVVAYCRRAGIDHRLLQMEVIVQRMIQPELAGAAFTVNPANGSEEVVVEACEGPADALMAGRQSALPPDHPLLRKYLPEIERTARRIHCFFGAPQDVEFAIEAGTLYIVQARPITRIAFAPAIGEWTNADFRDGGVSSGVCTPLMWSLYDFVWEHALKTSLRELRLWQGDFQAGRMFFGRPYWNLGAVKQCVAKIPGFVEREFDSDLNVQIQYDGHGLRTPMTPGRLLRAIPTLIAVKRFLAEQERSANDWLAHAFDALEQRYARIPDDPAHVFRELIERDYLAVESSYFRMVFATSLAKLDFKTSFPDADFTALVAALPELRHMAPLRALRDIAERGESDVTPLLARFRHHSLRGLDIRAPRWDEDREAVAELLCSLTEWAGSDPRPAYTYARADALSRLPVWRRPGFNRKLERLRRFVWLREEMRDLSSRMYYLIRQFVLRIAQQRGIGDDVFFMTFRELLADDRSQVERNRERYESYRNFRAPNEIGARRGFSPGHVPGDLRGIAASPGTVHGIARVARSVEDAMRIEPHAILVCPFTDPGWTSVLSRVAGLVTEAGGLLSHAAVICREFGIPAVLGMDRATLRIPDGRAIALDGNTGRVEFLAQPCSGKTALGITRTSHGRRQP